MKFRSAALQLQATLTPKRGYNNENNLNIIIKKIEMLSWNISKKLENDCIRKMVMNDDGMEPIKYTKMVFAILMKRFCGKWMAIKNPRNNIMLVSDSWDVLCWLHFGGFSDLIFFYFLPFLLNKSKSIE